MADARRRDEWERTALSLSVLGKVMGGKWVDPRHFNPYHREPPKTPAQERADQNRALRLMERGLKDVAGVR